jgi:hypothetical protein
MGSSTFSQGHAVVVGVGADLPNTVDDAVGLAGILKEPGRCAYPPGQVHLLTGPEATRARVLAVLDSLAQATTAQSSVLVYFSGHGYRVASKAGHAYYLMPHGYDLSRLPETAISGAELTDRLRAVTAQKLLLLLDCCYAGGLDATKGPGGLELQNGALPSEALSLLAEGGGRALIASSQDNEVSFAGKPYSAFTLALIEALCGAGTAVKDGYVRLSDLALYTNRMVVQRTKERQHPILSFKQADNFALAYYAGGDAQPKALPFQGQPEIESEPGELLRARLIDQRGQAVHGPQTNLAGDTHGPVLGGTFHGPVSFGGGDTTHVHGGFYQPGMTVGGDLYQAARDLTIGGGSAAGPVEQGGRAVTGVFTELLGRIQALTADDQLVAKPLAEQARTLAEAIQRGGRGPEAQPDLERRLRALLSLAPEVARPALTALADPAGGADAAIQAAARKVLQG